MKKSSHNQPFAKRSSSAALTLIIGLTVFNFAYSYAVGLPLPRAVVASYVESVYALGDAQVRGYEAVGVAVVAVASMPAEMHLGTPLGFGFKPQEVEAISLEPLTPEPLLNTAPNQISIAK
ncbi:MAG: hypothetical protein Q8P58_01615 [Candidatus Adlerbacteria bacterium]|nr:hypothetical protein [Candidatus Adlerbacteria bacterium]MDZ4226257.1 hypothetical protein [Patescibacteria group bacterium]